MRCGSISSNAEYYIASRAVTSSCDVENPDWKIGFSSGELNKESSFLHVYNALFYLKSVPVFYMPYFAFPTDDTRRTGLLRPEIGYTRDEGIYFAQPIYIAPFQSWDLELDPQYRDSRGKGLYSTLRFADSAYSNGFITAGYFKEIDSYRKKEDLKNSEHYGYDIFYDRSLVFADKFDKDVEDGLKLNIKYLNDIDYQNLKSEKSETTDRLVTSRLNYFLRNENNYIGVYAKYFIDTDSSDNSETLQEIPTLQYHKFLDKFLVNNIQYSVDTQYHNYYREKGVRAQQFELQLPVTFYMPLLDDALRFSISENIYMMRANYDGAATPEDYGQYLRNYHTISLYSDLAKAYESFFHKIYFGADYIIPSFDKQSGYLDKDGFIPINTEEKQIALNFKQYFYDIEGNKMLVHSMRQPYYFDNDDYKFAPLENKFEVKLSPQISLSNEVQLSHQSGNVVKSLTYASFIDEKNRFYFSHTYNKDEDNNYISADFESKVLKNSSVFGEIQYDIDESFIKSWSIGWGEAKRCWDYRLVYKEDVTPKLTSSGKASSVSKKGIYLLFNLFPLGGVKYEYATESQKAL